MWQQLQKKYLGSTIPLINVHGMINASNAAKVAKRISKINASRAVALAVSVDSPGGYPVQSLIIANRIKEFAAEKNLKVFTFARSLAASGGYFVLCTGNHVCADTSSIVGSIGVVYPKWNLTGLLDMTELQNKNLSTNKDALHNIFNPFNPTNQEQKEQVRQICDWTHEKFINHVKSYRGNKLSENTQLFTGDVFNGEEAKENGLVDQVGSMMEILERYYPGCQLDVGKPENSFREKIFG